MVLEFESRVPRGRSADRLVRGADTVEQIVLTFPDLEAARAYADRNAIAHHLVPSGRPQLKLQAYADNFK